MGPEVGDVDPAGSLPFVEEQRSDQETRKRKERRYGQETTGDPVDPRVVEQNGQQSDPPKTVQSRIVFESCWERLVACRIRFGRGQGVVLFVVSDVYAMRSEN